MNDLRFNLLPARYAARLAERRLAVVTAFALVAVLGLLVLAGLSQSRRLHQAQKRHDVEQARNAALVARRGQLAPFRQLADAIVGRERLLAAAMGSQVSWASVLSSLATSFPGDASLTSLSAELDLSAFAPRPPAMPGAERSVIGTTTLNGYSTAAFTPGVDGILNRLLTVRGLSEPRMQLGARSEIGTKPVTTFDGNAFVDARALSGRYADGLPAGDHVEVPAAAGGGAPTGTPAPAVTGGPR